MWADTFFSAVPEIKILRKSSRKLLFGIKTRREEKAMMEINGNKTGQIQPADGYVEENVEKEYFDYEERKKEKQ